MSTEQNRADLIRRIQQMYQAIDTARTQLDVLYRAIQYPDDADESRPTIVPDTVRGVLRDYGSYVTITTTETHVLVACQGWLDDPIWRAINTRLTTLVGHPCWRPAGAQSRWELPRQPLWRAIR